MTQNIREARLRKQRQASIYRFIAALVFISLILVLYATRESWIGKFEGIGSKYQDATVTDAEESTGFPISISGGIDYQTGICDNSFVLLGDTSYKIYSTDGKLIATRQHAFSNPILETAGKRVLVYDLNGNSYRVDSKAKEIYSGTTEQKILFARISESGYTAIVTESDNYICNFSIYDANGQNIYNCGSLDRLIDLSFDSDSKGCSCVILKASGGTLVSSIKHISFSSDAEDWTTPPVDTLSLSCNSSRSSITMIGSTQLSVYDIAGSLLMSYSYDDPIADFASANGKTALLLKNVDTRTSTIVFADDTSPAPQMIYFTSEPECIRIYNDRLYVFTGSSIVIYNSDGTEEASYEVPDGFDDFVIIGADAFLLGFDKIDMLELK